MMQRDRIGGKPDEKVAWGSDVAAQMLRRLGIAYVSLNPGASYRGLHDSIVNHLGNERPGILLCLHEDHSVSIAHGYAKATGEPMACVLHSNVGLLHGMMSLFNAWCDREPELWPSRIRLAERLGACVVTDLKQGAVFPTDHPAHYLPPFNVLPKPARELFCEADVILALDWVDLGGALRQAKSLGTVAAKV